MFLEKINGKLQESLAINKYELYFAYLMLLGLFISIVSKTFISDNIYQKTDEPEFEQVSTLIYQKLDSIEKAEQTTYIGTDTDGNVNQELLKGDTIIKKESLYPNAKKKQSPTNKINLNKATKFELMKLPGIGDKTAVVIMDYRKTNPFGKIEDIMNVKGIGPKKFEKMQEFIKVE